MKRTFYRHVLAIAAALTLANGIAGAAGFNYIHENGFPLKWDTSAPIPVYTDGGGAFTYDFDGVTPFLTIERANEITQFAYDQWSNVPTSTLEAVVSGTIESMTGIADVTGANATEFYGTPNGYGIWVLYDTDGSILEDYFGTSRLTTLGIAFPEIALPDGTIVEATVVLNGWNVSANDVNGERVAGVFTHEFGHTLNLSHAQVNGQFANFSYVSSPLYPGVEGCGVDPVHIWNYPPSVANPVDPNLVEAMYPFIGHKNELGRAMSYVTTPDDIAAISNLYPTPDYESSTGSISGRLLLKDGTTEYAGVNIVARNVNDPMGDAISAVTGHQTVGLYGPDGSFTIRGLNPGESYVVYTEKLRAGTFQVPTALMASVPEYWNEGEGNDPVADDPCDATPILAEAGVTRTAEFVFNGYEKGIDFTAVGPFFLTDLAKNGKSVLGIAGSTPFVYEPDGGVEVVPGASTDGGAMSKTGKVIATGSDVDGDGMYRASIYTAGEGFTELGYLGEVECGSGSEAGLKSSTAWDISDDGKTVVGLAYQDKNGDGVCNTQRLADPEINGFVWTAKTGMQALSIEGYGRTPDFIRAHAVSGNGKVILGADGRLRALAWVDGELIDLRGAVGATEAIAINYDGTRAALNTPDGVVLWDYTRPGEDAFENVGGLAWCEDMDYIHFFLGNLCDIYPPEFVQQTFGPIPVLPTDMTDDGQVIVGRAGSFFTGFAGAVWMEPVGWMTWEDFFAKQGVVEASLLPFDNPTAISANGTEMVGGFVGATYSWFIEMNQVYVCENGTSVQTGFPKGLFEKLAEGAEFGRCEHID